MYTSSGEQSFLTGQEKHEIYSSLHLPSIQTAPAVIISTFGLHRFENDDGDWHLLDSSPLVHQFFGSCQRVHVLLTIVRDIFLQWVFVSE